MSQKNETTLAILMFTGMLLSNSVIFTIVPYLTMPVEAEGLGYNAFQVLFCYSVVATLCMLPWAMKQGKAGLKTTRWKHYWLRAVLEYGAYASTLIALSYLSDTFTLPMHTAINFITPMLATVAAILILKEKSHLHTWLALGVGFIGVLVVTRPGIIPTSPGVLYALGAALGFSMCGIVIKKLCSTESPQKIAFFMLAMTTVFAIPMGVKHWQNPTPEVWIWMAVIGVLSYLSQYLVGKAISKVPYMVLIPLNFASLIFSTVLSTIVFGKTIDTWTLAGAIIIVGSTLYNAQRNRALAAKEALQATAM